MHSTVFKHVRRTDLVHGVTFVNTPSVSLYTSSIFVYTNVLAHNLNINTNQTLRLDENEYQGRSQRLYHVEAYSKNKN